MAKRIDIGEQLRRAIAQAEKAGKSRYAIAQAAGLTDSQVKRIAEATITPRIDTAATLADAIGYRLALIPK